MRKLLLCVCGVLLAAELLASDFLSTRYVNGEFVSECAVDAVAPLSVCDSVVDDLIEQITSDYEQLFTWAFKGLGRQGGDDERDEVVITIKESTFDKMSGLCHMVADIEVSRITTFRDIALDSRVLQTKLADGTTRVDVDIFYSNSFLKKAYGTFFVKPLSDARCELRIQIHVRFGWFFNIFITQKRFRNIVEWRMHGFMQNLRTEAERRYTQQLMEEYFIK
ncbi:MAG: hypothetical protein ACI392_02175 [Paludibacteraceae bacterium]